MAVVQGTFTSFTDANNLPIDMSDTLSFLNPWETPTLNLIGPNSLPVVDELKHQWLEETLRALDLTVASSGTTLNNVTDPVTFTVGTGMGQYLAPGDILKIDSEYVLVTTNTPTADNTVVIKRGYGGTTPATHADSTAIKILGHAVLQTSALGATRPTTTDPLYNYVQHYEDNIVVTSTEQAIRKYVEQNTADAQLARATRAFWKLLNRTLLYGKKVAPTAANVGAMDGIIARLATNTYAKGGSAYLTFDMLNVAARDSWNLGGHITHAIVPAFQRDQINKLNDSLVMTSRQDNATGVIVTQIHTSYGDIQVVADRDMPVDSVLLIEAPRIRMGFLQGHAFSAAPIADTTRFVHTWQMIAAFTSETRNENAHAIITGLASS